jgi:hypothetical protein
MFCVFPTASQPCTAGKRWILPRWIVLTCALPAARIRLFTLDVNQLLFGGAYALLFFFAGYVRLQPRPIIRALD